MNKFYPKRFKRREDGSIYLENVEPASQYVRKMTDRLCACRDEEILLSVKKGHSERLPALNESLIFPAPEAQIMGKMYDRFVREKLLDDTADNRMILVGKGERMNRTLGSMIRSVFAEKEISVEYLELLKDIFGRVL